MEAFSLLLYGFGVLLTWKTLALMMVGHRDEVHIPPALLLGQFRKILRSPEEGRDPGAVIRSPFEETIGMGHHDDILVRHSRQRADDDTFLEARHSLDIPAHVCLEAGTLAHLCGERRDAGAIVVSNEEDRDLDISLKPVERQMADVLHVARNRERDDDCSRPALLSPVYRAHPLR